jgi:glyoxylase-like metal-dependent hydrolase (beta-lactamase superfamily II)
MKSRTAFLLLVVAAVLGVVEPSAQAPKSVRLYVLDCGTLLNRDPSGYDLTSQQVGGVTELADPCFLIVNPRGTLLWETGIEQVAANRPERFRNDRIDKSLKSQLAEIGYPPAAITYLAVSHLHGDHIGNANDYASSTWIVQKTEREYMFSEGLPPNISNKEYSALKTSKTIVADGDHDVFGDGSVVLLATPGHSPGHQSLVVKLAKTGPIVLSGDLYHYPAERSLNKLPRADKAEQTTASRVRLEAYMKKTSAQLWIQHDIIANRTLKKSPAFYE